MVVVRPWSWKKKKERKLQPSGDKGSEFPSKKSLAALNLWRGQLHARLFQTLKNTQPACVRTPTRGEGSVCSRMCVCVLRCIMLRARHNSCKPWKIALIPLQRDEMRPRAQRFFVSVWKSAKLRGCVKGWAVLYTLGPTNGEQLAESSCAGLEACFLQCMHELLKFLAKYQFLIKKTKDG